MSCPRHPDRPNTANCSSCGRAVCEECRVLYNGMAHCKECYGAGRTVGVAYYTGYHPYGAVTYPYYYYQQQYAPQYGQPYRQAGNRSKMPWRFGDAGSVGWMVMVLGLFGCVFSLGLGNLFFRTFTNPELTGYFGMFGSDPTPILGSYASYYLIAGIIAAGVYFNTREADVAHKDLAALLMAMPLGIIFITGTMAFVFPFSRGPLALFPLVGMMVMMYGLASSDYIGMSKTSLANLRSFTLMEISMAAALGAIFMIHHGTIGGYHATFTYVAFVALGFLLLYQAFWIFRICEAKDRAGDKDDRKDAEELEDSSRMAQLVAVLAAIMFLVILAPPFERLLG